MIATRTDCPSVDVLNRLVDGNCSQDEFESAVQHVDQCENCQSQLPGLVSKTNGLTNLDSEEDSIFGESACQFAIARLVSINVQRPMEVPMEQIGPYEILEPLGQGGMGMVCLARHNRLKRRCAIKFLPPHRVTEPGWLDRFDREMTTVAALEHPGIVRATDAGTDSGWHYLVMEYLQGMDVGRVAHRLGKIPIADACEIARQTALALAHVHNHDLIHRDIKPSNLMLTNGGTVKLLDLGLVLAGDDPLAADDRLTTVGHLMGTLPAMSPEQLLDSRNVQSASDIYSLGATLYRLIAGRWPHSGDAGLAARVLAITGESGRSKPPPLSDFDQTVDAELERFVSRMMHRQPDQRPDAPEVAERLASWSVDANLKALLRRAESTPVPDVAVTPTFHPATQPASPPPNNPSNRMPSWFGPLGWFAAAALLATVVIQIKTDRGLVTLTTDGKDTSVSVQEDGTLESESAPQPLEQKSVASADNPTHKKIYLGEDFDHWLGVFRQEQQIERIGQAMRAVELLSRDTPKRAEAARVTLQMANEHGSLLIEDNPDQTGNVNLIGGLPSPSSRFMGYLTQTFPHYLPSPGLAALEESLAEGNEKAKIAAILLLKHFVTGVYVNTRYPERQDSAAAYVSQLGETDQGRSQVEGLLRVLGEASNDLQPIASQSNRQSRVSYTTIDQAYDARHHAWETAVQITGQAGPHIEPPTWIADYVIERSGESIAEYQRRKLDPKTNTTRWSYENPFGFGGFGGGGGGMQTQTSLTAPDWMMPRELFSAAVELQREGRLEMPTDFMAETLTHPSFSWYSSDGLSLQDVAKAMKEIDDNAYARIAYHLDRLFREVDHRYQDSNNAEYVRTLTFVQPRLEEGLADIYTAHVDQPKSAQQRLEDLMLAIPELQSFGQNTNPDLSIFESMVRALDGRAD
ncbi:serine/threonine protein kinase [Crateriforma conspicua]|uniref:Serine/threonine-protein kinase PknB n=1 Tax=Crateriforma conspicua TaxID=2527996 RepID=A0A5C5XXS1_9PLAN|nr:serine/threonine-protein kinase [Crateriforma conspicua]TWT68157.1 Serine/threonine-protein kinase PknB [Crateriforma conspicua]